jgi:hypothetical protein
MPYNLPCNWKAGFSVASGEIKRVGYLTDFNGLGLSAPLAKDLAVYCPYSGAAPPQYAPLGAIAGGKVNVSAVLENYSWAGGAGDSQSFSCYMSSANANLLKALMSATLTTNAISSIGWWVTNYDEATKKWFEETYPKAPARPTGQLKMVGKNISLQIGGDPVKVGPDIDVSVTSVSFELVPAANQTATFSMASSPTTVVTLNWGVKTG